MDTCRCGRHVNKPGHLAYYLEMLIKRPEMISYIPELVADKLDELELFDLDELVVTAAGRDWVAEHFVP